MLLLTEALVWHWRILHIPKWLEYQEECVLLTESYAMIYSTKKLNKIPRDLKVEPVAYQGNQKI